MRTVMRTLAAALTTTALSVAVVAGTSAPAHAGSSSLTAPAKSGSVSTSYSGSTSGTGGLDPALPCTPTYCHDQKVAIKASPTYWKTHSGALTVTLSWAGATNDLDLYLLDKSGKEVATSGGAVTTSEKLTVTAPAPGAYVVRVISYVAQPGLAFQVKATLATKAR